MLNDRHNHPPPGRPSPQLREGPRIGVDAPPAEPPHAQDHWRVNLAEEWELKFWSREFGCTENDLRKAVEAVGTNAGTVREHLASQIQQQRS